MPRSFDVLRRTACTLLLTGLVVTTACSGPAQAAPVEPLFPQAIDDYAAYDGADSCDPTDKPGATQLLALLEDAYSGTSGYISRACSGDGTGSEHEEGRAIDWMISASQHAYTDDFFDWVFATDEYGNKDAMIRRLGIMYMIWDHRMWRAYDPDAGWQPYDGANPHTDHVHISMSWDGALEKTTWSTKQDAGILLDQARFAATWRDPGRLDVFRRGTSGSLEQRSWIGNWGGWQDLGGDLESGPAAAWTSRRSLWVFAESPDGKLEKRRWRAADGWRPWQTTNRNITAAPGVAVIDGRLDLVVRKKSGSVGHRFWTRQDGWSSWEDLGGIVTAPPAAVWSAPDRFDVLARGTEGGLHQNSWRTGIGWSGWVSLGGVLTSGPAATSLKSGTIDTYVRTERGSVSARSRDVDGAWSAWEDLGGMHASGATASSLRTSRIDLFTRDPSGGLNQDIYTDEAGWTGWYVR